MRAQNADTLKTNVVCLPKPYSQLRLRFNLIASCVLWLLFGGLLFKLLIQISSSQTIKPGRKDWRAGSSLLRTRPCTLPARPTPILCGPGRWAWHAPFAPKHFDLVRSCDIVSWCFMLNRTESNAINSPKFSSRPSGSHSDFTAASPCFAWTCRATEKPEDPEELQLATRNLDLQGVACSSPA